MMSGRLVRFITRLNLLGRQIAMRGMSRLGQAYTGRLLIFSENSIPRIRVYCRQSYGRTQYYDDDDDNDDDILLT